MREDKGRNLLKTVTDYTVIDLETTDKNTKYAKIIELSALRVRNDIIVETFSQLVNPQMHISKKISDLTGITDEMVKDMPTIDKVLGSYLDFISDDIILGHNIASYDTTIICDYAKVFLDRSFKNDMIDTRLLAERHCNLDLPNYKLTTIAEHYGVVNERAHRALSDCYANFEVYKKLKCDFNPNKASNNSRERTFTYNESKDTTKNCPFIDKIFVPEENLDLHNKNIVITGEFQFGSQGVVESFISSKGANIQERVNKKNKIDYLIIGSQVSSKWSHGNYGNKIVNALKLIDEGHDIKIIFEKDFFGKLGD